MRLGTRGFIKLKMVQKTRFDLSAWAEAYRTRTGLTGNGDRLWQRWEVDLLKALYPNYDLLRARLPHRTSVAIQHHCAKIGLVAAHERQQKGRRRPYAPRQKAVLKILFSTLPAAQLRHACDAMRITARGLGNLAAKQGWRRPRTPFKLVGILPLDNLRRRCFALGVSLVEIDDWSKAKGYFSNGGWKTRGVDQRLIDRAHRILDDAEHLT